jgi:hypothetical protein
VVLLHVGSEDEGSDGGKLDQDVDGWTRGVLKWVTNGVTDNSGNVSFSEFSVLKDPMFNFLSLIVVDVVV